MIELRISSPSLACAEVARLLRHLGVEASVTPTTNVAKGHDGAFSVEPGAHVLLPDCEKEAFSEKVWPALKAAFSLRCGWVDASTKAYRGCTENYCRPSACPAQRASGLSEPGR